MLWNIVRCRHPLNWATTQKSIAVQMKTIARLWKDLRRKNLLTCLKGSALRKTSVPTSAQSLMITEWLSATFAVKKICVTKERDLKKSLRSQGRRGSRWWGACLWLGYYCVGAFKWSFSSESLVSRTHFPLDLCLFWFVLFLSAFNFFCS